MSAAKKAERQASVLAPIKTFLDFQENLSSDTADQRPRMTVFDYGLSVALALIALIVSLWGFDRLGLTLKDLNGMDVWFQGDINRVMENMTDTQSDHHRVSVHPAASILIAPFGIALKMLGLEPFLAAKIVVLAFSSLSIGLMYFALRYMGLGRLACAIFTGLMISSASFLHWHSVIESSVPSQMTIVTALVMLAYGKTKSWIWWALMSAGTLSITITSWCVGIWATLMRWPIRPIGLQSPALKITLAAFAIIAALAVVQNLTFNKAAMFFNPKALQTETNFIEPMREAVGRSEWGPISNLRSLYVTTIVAPNPYVHVMQKSQWVPVEYYVIDNQDAKLTPYLSGRIAIGAWLVLFGLGIWGAVSNKRTHPVALGVGLMIISFTALLLVYGELTFLYAPYFLPVIIFGAAFSWFSPHRYKALTLAIVVITLGGMNNVLQFNKAVGIAEQITSGVPPKIDPS